MRYFTNNLTSLSFAEIRSRTSNPVWLAMIAVLKLLHVPLRTPGGFAMEEQVNRLSLDEVSQPARLALGQLWMDCEAIGLREGFLYTTPMLGPNEAVGAAIRSHDGRVAATLIYGKTIYNNSIIREAIQFGFASQLTGDRTLATSGAKPQTLVSETCLRENMPGCSVAEVYARHIERLDGVGSREILPILNDDDLEDFLTTYRRKEIDFNVQRGHFVELSAREIEKWKSSSIAKA